MEYAYFLEVSGAEKRSNKAVFKLIQEMGTPDERVYSDTGTESRTGLKAAIGKLEQGDILIVRSLVDVADTADAVALFLLQLQSKGAELYSCEEPYLNGKCAYDIFQSVRGVLQAFTERKKKEGYNKARAEGRVGRPGKQGSVAVAIALYRSKKFSIAKIEEITGISKSTLYKYLRESSS